jgi:membrane associated rhomboid family serine protease
VTLFVVYALLPYVAAFAGVRLVLLRGVQEIRAGRATRLLLAVVGVPSVVGLVWPAVREALQRDATRIGSGEVWRLATALLQQDGGIAGTAGNLAALLVVGSVAEELLGAGAVTLAFVGCGLLAQGPSLLWQPIGAGNSVANFGVSGALAMTVLLTRAPAVARLAALAALTAGVGLVAVGDIHGPPVLMGAAFATALDRTRGRTRPGPR